jgi:hypothetical protein
MTFLSLNKQPLSTLVLIASSTALIGCNGGSSSGGASIPQAEITTERVANRIDTSIANVANCEKSMVLRMASSINTQQLKDILDVSRSLNANQTVKQVIVRPSADVGSCAGNPGSVSVTSEHGNGDTRYELDFNAYCTTGPEGDTVISGILVSTEDGTPTDTGPMISALDLSTSNMQIQYENSTGQAQTAVMTISGARTTYGVPATWGSGVPTIDKPDVTNVNSVKVDIETTGEVHTLNNLRVSRYGGNTATVSIQGGSYITPTGDYVNISTEDGKPLTIDVSNGEVTAGEVVLSGSNSTTAVIAATPGSRIMKVSVDGTVLDGDIDCSNTDAAVKEVVGLLLSRLPIY